MTVPPTIRRIISAALAALFLAVQLGWWAPRAPAVLKDSSERFPCETSACACASARQCWESCCCHTDADKIAWAAKHNIALPDRLAKLAKQLSNEPRTCAVQRSQGADSGACCASFDQPDPPADCRDDAPAAAPAPAEKFVLGWHVLKCQGAGCHWLVAGFVPLGGALSPLELFIPPDCGAVAPVCLMAESVCFPPASPPPRA